MTRIDPGMPAMVVLRSDELTVDRDGDLRQENEYVMPPEYVEQYRSGYRCLACHAVQTVPFPEVCQEVYKDGGGCGYRMRDRQPEDFAYQFRGYRTLWPHADEDSERERFTKRTGIVLPRGVG